MATPFVAQLIFETSLRVRLPSPSTSNIAKLTVVPGEHYPPGRRKAQQSAIG